MRASRERFLDRVLDGASHPRPSDDDTDLSGLVELGDELRAIFAVEAPVARRERAMFAAAVAARPTRRGRPTLALPAVAMLALIVFVSSLASTALPGQALYPVRKVLTSLNLADEPVDVVDARLQSAEQHVASAESHLTEARLEASFDEALAAFADLGVASDFVDELDAFDRPVRQKRIEALLGRAAAVIAALPAEITGALSPDDLRGNGERELGTKRDDDDEGPDAADDEDDDDDDETGDNAMDETGDNAADTADDGDTAATNDDLDDDDVRLNEAEDDTAEGADNSGAADLGGTEDD